LTDLLVLGDCRPDVVVAGQAAAAYGRQQQKQVTGMSLVIGGAAAITAVAAARLGLRVALVAAVGDDPAGHFMLTELAREGVNISGVAIRDDASTGMSVVLPQGGGLGVLTASGPVSTLTAADVPGSLLAGARHVHVSSYFHMQRSLGPGLAAMFKAARAGGTTTSLDTNAESPGQWDTGQLSRVLRQCDLLLADEDDALAISGADSVPAAAAALLAPDRAIAIRLGASSVRCWSGSQQHVAMLPLAAAADTTGAGDCFAAGFLAGMLRGLAVPEAMALGCAVGSASAAGAGGTASCPDLPAALELAKLVTLQRQA
jgi:sugar/nucleoside kinase (ribokinase family)